MYSFSQRSITNLENVDERLKSICHELIKVIDFTVIEGFRTRERQKELFDKGFSKIDGFNKKGKHNYFPSRAVDIIPYKKGHNPLDSSKESEEMFYKLAEEFKKVAKELNIAITWGGDWESFKDLPHFQI